MPLTNAKMTVAIDWKLSLPVSGYRAREQGPDEHAFKLASQDLGTYDQLLSETFVVPVGHAQVIDFRAFQNPNAEETGLRKLVGILITVTGADVLVHPGFTAETSPGSFWYFPSAGILVKDGGMESHADPAPGHDLDSGDSGTLYFSNEGASDATVKVTVWGGS